MSVRTSIVVVAALASCANAQVVAWTKGMFCKNGNSNTDQPNAAYPVNALVNLATNDWFLRGVCRDYPPPSGEFLNIPANGSFTAELASNRAFTTLSYNGQKATDWPDGKTHPDNWSINITDPLYPPTSAGCLSSPLIRARGIGDAQGTAFAIAYKNDITAVKLSDFTVFSVAGSTPFKRVATYQVPNLPACPTGGCLCAWAWVPNHCGQDAIFMNAYRCQVTGASSSARAVAPAQAPVWCESDQDKCVSGAKQMAVVWQKDGNNIVLPGGLQKDNTRPAPGYNSKLGFTAGAQTDIFVATATTPTPTCAPAPTTTSTVTSTTTITIGYATPTKLARRHDQEL
ncbi:hypothetical protein AURDEDRAFT_170377 [Auricularia subglabra TFB-10046 SS5]|nr:hypothetical protein AURDEDRAFT_170377 [Auricularia subglabra TFB-10046 SS5]